jgi:hypothetical protein
LKKRVGRMRVKKKDKAVSESVVAWHYSALTLLDCMGQRWFEYSDITAARKICAAMMRSLNSSAPYKKDHYTLFLKINTSCVKICKLICDVL